MGLYFSLGLASVEMTSTSLTLQPENVQKSQNYHVTLMRPSKPVIHSSNTAYILGDDKLFF